MTRDVLVKGLVDLALQFRESIDWNELSISNLGKVKSEDALDCGYDVFIEITAISDLFGSRLAFSVVNDQVAENSVGHVVYSLESEDITDVSIQYAAEQLIASNEVYLMLDSDEPSGQTKHTFDLSNVDEHQIKKYTAKSTPIKKEEPEKVEAVATPAKEPVAEATQPAQQAVVSELEEFLDLLTWSGVIGAIKLKLVLYGYSMDHGKEGLKQEFEKFTPAGKQKYGKFFKQMRIKHQYERE